jgi:hypothetical protein
MQNSIHQITLLKRLGLAVLVLQFPALAQQATLALGSGNAAQGGSANLGLTMTTSGGEQPASVQWTMTYPAQDIASVNVTAGTSDAAAGKSISCSSTPGSTICVTYGMNSTVIADGNLANATFVVAPGAPDLSAAIQVTGVSISSPAGLAVPGAANGGAIAIARVAAPTVSGLSCNPATVTAPGTASCTVTLSGATSTALAVGLGSGNAAVTVPASVTVAASASSAIFTANVGSISASQTAKLTASSGASAQSFTLNLTAPAFTISGNAGTSGATMTLTGPTGASTTTAATGAYSLTGLGNGTYTVTPSKNGFAFTPASTTVTINGGNQTVNFTAASTATFTISGTAGTGTVTLALTGTSTGSATASAAGAYNFGGLANGTYTVTPSKSGFTFTPPSAAVTISGGNQTVNFTATSTQTWTISGNAGTGGATVGLTGATNGTVMASATGAYSFTNLSNGTYTLTASKSGFTFTPGSTTVTISGGNQTVNFTASSAATFTISGMAGTGGAALSLSGPSAASVTASSTGAYNFPGLANGTYTVTPSKSGFTFNPPKATMTISGGSQTANFTAAATPVQTWSISGNAGTGGATITLSGSSTAITTAAATGAYSFAGLNNGTYTLTPAKTNFTFTPASTTVTVNGGNQTANFSAVDPPPSGGSISLIQLTQNEVSKGKSVSVSFDAPTKSGNTIVAYVIWNNPGSVYLTDSQGNVYAKPRNPTSWGSGNNAEVLYASNIAGGADTITATFQSPVSAFGVLYVHEFAGINTANPVDVSAASSGNSATLNSGFATTTAAGDLIFGAGVSDNVVSTVGPGFSVLDVDFGNITESKIAGAPGSYAATATHIGSSWAMEMVAFRAGSGTPVTTLPPVPVSLQSSNVTASSLTLTWSEPSSSVAIAGYNVYRNGVQVGTATAPSFPDTGLSASTTYAYTVTAFSSSNVASAPSQQLMVTTAAAPTTVPALVQVTENNISSGPNVPVSFASATKAGNTIVAYVIWSNAGTVSLADSRGNHFVSAGAPVTWGTGYHAQVFYASSISGGADTVTATFQTAVSTFGVLYIHEYSGISATNPVDVTASASGAGPTLNSGLATTTSANDLIFGAGVSDNNVSAPGTGFTMRDMAFGNITEDMIANTPGPYAATASHFGTNWGMQMVAFRAGH